MIKRCLIGFTVLISCFLFASKASALEAHNINDLDLFSEEITEDYLYETYGVSKDAFPYVVMFASENSVISGRYEVYLFFMTENDNLGLRDYESGGVFFCSFYGDFAYYTWTSTNAITEEIDLANYTINYKSGASKGTWRGSKTKDDFYYFSNFDILTLNNPETNNLSDVKITTDVYLPANNTNNNLVIDEINKTITIPIKYFYQDGEWQNYYLYFASPTINDMNYSLKFEYISKDTNLPELPIELILNDKIDDAHQHLANIANSKYTSANGFGGGFSINAGYFGGGGGGGRLDDDTDTISCMPTSSFTYNGSFSNERIYGLAVLSLNSCYDLTGKTTDDFNTEAIKITYNARLVDLNTEGELGNDVIGDMLEDIRNEYELEQENISFDIFAPVIKLVTDKLPIINQFNQILSQFNYDEQFDTPPVFEVDIPFFGLEDIEVFNFQFFDEYRDYLMNLQCLIMAIYTAVKCYRIVSCYFGGGGSE